MKSKNVVQTSDDTMIMMYGVMILGTFIGIVKTLKNNE